MSILQRIAAAVVVAIAAIACGSPAPSSSTSPSPGQVDPSGIDSKAADLRVRLDLLLGEHVMVIVKVSNAAAGNRPDEYAAYASLLTTNGDELSGVMTSAFGASTAGRFDKAWRIQDGYLIDYTIGQVSHNTTKSNGAVSGLVNGFVPQFAQFFLSAAQMPVDNVTQMANALVMATTAVIDAQVAKSYSKMYSDLRTAHAQSTRLGDALASGVARKFPDKFPGDPSRKAVDLRVSLNTLLQEYAYVSTMATGALAGSRNAEQAAALGALAANAGELRSLFGGLFGAPAGTTFDQVWSARNVELVIYSGSSDASRRQNALIDLIGPSVAQLTGFIRDTTGIHEPTLSVPVQTQTQALVRVIDDQRSNSLKRVAGDDRTAAASMEPIANLVASAMVAKLPSRF